MAAIAAAANDISIHTPTQGVTTIIQNRQKPKVISIHTPTQGVTEALKKIKRVKDNFNPHSHAGSDLGNGMEINHVGISIHTPTQGVTLIDSQNINF